MRRKKEKDEMNETLIQTCPRQADKIGRRLESLSKVRGGRRLCSWVNVKGEGTTILRGGEKVIRGGGRSSMQGSQDA